MLFLLRRHLFGGRGSLLPAGLLVDFDLLLPRLFPRGLRRFVAHGHITMREPTRNGNLH